METLKITLPLTAPEFNNLTPDQQTKRWQALSQTLGTILEDSSAFGLTQTQTALSFSDALELHFTGKIERLPYEKPQKKRRKTKKAI